jgi:hypothetical protein
MRMAGIRSGCNNHSTRIGMASISLVLYTRLEVGDVVK